MRQDCCREYDKSQRSREPAIAAFDHARQEMMATPFQRQFDAYRDCARALVPYLDLEELSREAQLADRRSRQLRLVRDDLAGAEERVRNLFDEAFMNTASPYVPQSRNNVKPVRDRQVPRSFSAVTSHRSTQCSEVSRARSYVKAW